MSSTTAPAGRHVGRSSPRLDGLDKVRGSFPYGVDLSLPGMLHAKVKRSEVPHALLLGVDTAEAERVPGVRAVITGASIGDHRASRFVRDEPILAKDRVRYAGEPVAVVAADTVEAAEEAVRRIEVAYEALPVVRSPQEALAGGAPLIHPDWAGYWAAPATRRDGNVLNHASLRRGDVAAVFDRAEHVFEDTFATHMVHQASLEGRVAVAEIDGEGRVHVHSSHQFPFGLRQDLADILHLPVERIHVVATGLGGGFGGKLYAGVEPYCVLLAQATGRPVRLAHTREEEMIATSPRMGADITVRTAVDGGGRLLAREGVIHYDAGAYSESSPAVVSVGLLTLPGPYRWEALKVDSYAVYTNKANCGSYRGPGAPQAVFAGESQIDLIAAELGIDPLELRLMNAVEDGDLGPSGQVLRNVSLKETLRAAADRIGWGEPRGDGRGLGIACCWWTTTGGSSSAFIDLDEDGTVVLTTGATEIGTGAVTAGIAQILADELGVGLDDVRIVSADTDRTPYDFGAQGSRTAVQMGRAVMAAAADLRAKLVELAAAKLGCDPADLEVADGAVRVRGDRQRAVTLADLARMDHPDGELQGRGSWIAPPEEYDETTLEGAMLPAMQIPSFSAHAAEVAVDRDTGELALTRYVAAQDVGFTINPTYAEGQVVGGAVQGIGYAMLEELQYRDGVVANPNFTDYKLPTTMDVPMVEVELVEQPSTIGPYGAKGVGEPSVIPPAAAIANAVEDAAGVRLRRLPLTAERIFMALHADGGEAPPADTTEE